MVGALDLVSHEFKHSADTFSNDGTSQMTYVHLLSNVRGRKINNNSLLFDLGEDDSLD